MSRTYRNKAEIRRLFPRNNLKVNFTKLLTEKDNPGCYNWRRSPDDDDFADQVRWAAVKRYGDGARKHYHHHDITDETTRFEQKSHRTQARLQIHRFLRGDIDDVIVKPVQFSPFWLW